MKRSLWCSVSETQSWMSTWKRGSEKDWLYLSDGNMIKLGQKLFSNKNTSLYIKICGNS